MTSQHDSSPADGAEALEELREALEFGMGTQQPVERLRRHAMLPEAAELARTALKSSSAHTREAACIALDYIDDAAATADLRPLLADPDDLVAMRAADALCAFGEAPEVLVPRLREVLRKSEPELPRGEERIQAPCMMLDMPEARYHAARILGYLGEAAQAARPELCAALESVSGLVRAQAAKTLALIGEASDVYLPPLRQALLDQGGQSSRERVAAADMLLELGEPPDAVIPTLAEIVGEEDWTAVSSATNLLGTLGATASSAVPALQAACGSSDGSIARAAAEALGRIEGGGSVEGSSPGNESG